ncbi:MAG TPA: 5-formyltetrahydrofolate cyclo-ligase [Candidatus Micrarchaeota archaeon]|nr:5-formyltetrahydrofolate cyclo-ligase [Candidatus Micrarchaeota archaeon]
MITKKEIRESVSARRNALSDEDVILASTSIIENLQSSFMYKKARTVLFYCSIRGEVYTHGAISAALKGGKIVALPKTNTGARELNLYKIRSLSDLAKGAYGVLEPVPDHLHKIGITDIDLVIVPGVAFDKEGNRIGLGLGYYDRLLPGVAGLGRICALAYSFQIVEKIPHDAHDIPMDCIFCEDHVIDCKKFRRRPVKKQALAGAGTKAQSKAVKPQSGQAKPQAREKKPAPAQPEHGPEAILPVRRKSRVKEFEREIFPDRK